VGIYFSTQARKAFAAHAVGGAARKGIAAEAPRLRLMPGADALEFQPTRPGGPQRDRVKGEPGNKIRALLRSEFGIQTGGAWRIAWVHWLRDWVIFDV